MKIISPFKDFYDFKVGKYGVDPLLVYQRTRNLQNDRLHRGGKYALTRPRFEVQQHFDMPLCHHACLWIGHYVANDDKTKSKGFDVKRSFRPNMT